MREINTSIEINASAEIVWKVLTDFQDYPSWNPFIKSIQGESKIGSTLKVTIQPPKQKEMNFTPTVQACHAKQELMWLGKVIHSCIFEGQHRFQIESISPKKVKFIHSEIFKGILVPLMGKMLDKTQDGFENMNHAFKQRCEEMG
jgi:hypothetical protein